MKQQLQNQQGYALLVVLLMLVLFMSISAAFIAGSLNNAQQEETIDASNQSVAAAEMGVTYYTSEFELEVGLVKQRVVEETQLQLNELKRCIEQSTGPGAACDTEEERTAWEERIDAEMKKLYLREIEAEIADIERIAANPDDHTTFPFSEGDISYAITSVDRTGFNTAVDDPQNKVIRMEVEGNSEGSRKQLTLAYTIIVPDSFLDREEALKINMNVVVERDIRYEDIFDLTVPDAECSVLLTEEEGASVPYDCQLAAGDDLMSFIEEIQRAGLDPADFRVFTDNFKSDVCDQNCNSLNFEGISVVVQPGDNTAANNMNNLVNGNLIFNGVLDIGNNLINLGKNGVKQNIIVKELDVDNNIKNMYYTNFLVLGKNDGMKDARLRFGNNFQIDNYSRLCIDIDRILQSDLDRLAAEIEFSNSGSLIYYSSEGNLFKLTGSNGERRTDLYVTRMSDYSTFLENCGVTMKDTETVTTELAVPNVINTDFDIEVEY